MTIKKGEEICPFINGRCMGDRCHLFAADGIDCVFYAILRSLQKIAEALNR